MELRFSPLFSGSSGNAIYVGCDDAHILVDAGMSGNRVTGELSRMGIDPKCLDAILVTHEHADHIKGIGILSRKYDLPIYATNYMRNNTEPHLTWNDLAKGMIEARELGATLIDVPADTFLSSPREVTYDPAAVEKQKALIRELHDMGAEVLMSSHVMEFLPKEEVLALAEEQLSRGADIAKIVTNAETEAQLIENFEASLLLRRKIGKNFLFLCNYAYAFPHRIFGPGLGGCMFLCIENARKWEGGQPPIRSARAVLDLSEGISL
jgi:hypothetical protein